MFRRLRSLPLLSFVASRNLPKRLPKFAQQISMPFPRFNFCTTEPFDYLEAEQNLLEQLKTHKCSGCGAQMQCDQEEKQGYLPKKRALKVLFHNMEVEENPLNITGDQMSLRAQRLLKDQARAVRSIDMNPRHQNVRLNIDDIKILDTLENSNMMTKSEVKNIRNHKLKRMLCLRCHGMKHQTHLDESVEARVTSVEPDKIFDSIFNKVRKGSTILHVVDLSDFSATISKKAFENAKKKGCRVLLAINKIDVMPSKLDESKIKFWIRMRVAEYGMKIMPENIFLLSSKTGIGLKKLAATLRKMSENVRKSDKDLYIIGHTNAGKSSLINTLIKESNKYEKDFYRDPFKNVEEKVSVEAKAKLAEEGKGFKKLSLKKIEVKQEEEEVNEEELINFSDNEEIEIEDRVIKNEAEEAEQERQIDLTLEKNKSNEQLEELSEDEENEFAIKPEAEPQELTVSPFHGTTLELLKIEDLHLGWRIWDTPGIPNLRHVSTFMENQKDVTKLLHHKQVTPQKFIMKRTDSLWVGALARLDFNSGEEICALVYTSNMISLHKTQIEKSNLFYLKHLQGLLSPVFRSDPTKTVFKAYNIEVECGPRGHGLIEVDIYGVGWIGFYSPDRGNTKTSFTLYLPQEVGFNVREALVNLDNHKMPIRSRVLKSGTLQDQNKKKN